MSVLRAILGRFARFLVRVARTLDPGLAATPYWVMPERMAALRLRYPGAPEHWLELLARRTPIADAASSPSSRPQPEAKPAGTRPRFRTAESPPRPQPSLADTSHQDARPAVRFPYLRPRAPAIARPVVAVASSRPSPDAPAAPPRPKRPVLTFGVARVRNPIANLLRNEGRKERTATVRFPFDDVARPAVQDALPQPDRQDVIHREHQTVFPDRDAHPPYRPEWTGAPDSNSEFGEYDTGVRWPDAHGSVTARPSWPNAVSSDARHNPRFSALDNRWPELPPLTDESGAPLLLTSDEAVLLAEQIGGTWSA